MLSSLFESPEQRRKDKRDLRELQLKYGDKVVVVLESRVADEGLSPRDHKHWARLLRKARSKLPG